MQPTKNGVGPVGCTHPTISPSLPRPLAIIHCQPEPHVRWSFRVRCGILRYMSSAQSSQVLDRLLDPVAECLTPEVARALVNLRARPEIQARIDELARKSNEGTLSPIEQAEYRDTIEAIDFISILQAKARKRLPAAKQP